MAAPLDDIDRAILEAMQGDARATLEDVGAGVGLSPAAVQRRVARLRRTGVILGTCSVLDPDAVGVPILVLALVTLDRDGGGAEARLDDRLRTHPNVQQAYELAGSFDRAVVISAPNMETYRALARELFDEDPNVKRFASHVVMGTLKRSLSLPLERVVPGAG